MNCTLCLLTLAVFFSGVCQASTEDEKPNFILLLADDLGWNALQSYGSDFHETPHLDQLAAEGIRFTDAYAACTVCSPSRAAIMTGMYPARLRVTNWIPGTKKPFAKLQPPDWTLELEHRHTTLAEAFHEAGYKTANIGKWHLGGSDFAPEKQGFDRNIAGGSQGSPPGGYHLPNKLDLPGAKKGDYLTDRLTDEALALFEEWKEEPFFLYFPYYTVHTPIQGKKEVVEKYGEKQAGDVHSNATYAAMVQSLDESVGRMMAKLKELKLDERTVILFSSDNGGLSHKNGKPTKITLNDPFRRGKGAAYEGGTRVPLIVKWPGVTKAGAVSNEPVSGVDFYPTFLEIAGVDGRPEHNRNVDGASLVPNLRDPAIPVSRANGLFWHFPHYHAGGDSPYSAVREGEWKLVEFLEEMNVELYNLADDEGETKDLARSMPEKAEELRRKLHGWRAKVDAQMMEPNPRYDPAKAMSDLKKRKSK